MNAEKGSAVMPRLLGIGAIAVVALVSGTAFGGAENVEPAGFQGHGSSLRATVTLADGGARIVTLQGTGCTVAICSRVRALDINAESIWLDDLVSVHDVFPEGDGVSALFSFNVSFDEVVVTLFISGVRSKTLPVKVWDAILYEITPILPAISAVIIVASVLLLTPLLLARRSS